MRFKPRLGQVLEDVSACSAVYLVNLLPALAKLPTRDALNRLDAHFTAAIKAYVFNARRVRRQQSPTGERYDQPVPDREGSG